MACRAVQAREGLTVVALGMSGVAAQPSFSTKTSTGRAIFLRLSAPSASKVRSDHPRT